MNETHAGTTLGLDRLVRRLVAEDGFEDRPAAEQAIVEYERFFLNLSNPSAPAPSGSVDRVWKRHMLDTRAYARDCASWLGSFVHRDDGHARLGPVLPPTSNSPRHRLDDEEFPELVQRVKDALDTKPVQQSWIEQGRELLDSDPLHALREYKRLLTLAIEGRPSTPPKLIDEFWHQHILMSQPYYEFCMRVAGRYVHHAPNYKKPHGFHAPRFKRTHAAYKKRFGLEPDPLVWSHMGESGGGEWRGDDSCLSRVLALVTVNVALGLLIYLIVKWLGN